MPFFYTCPNQKKCFKKWLIQLSMEAKIICFEPHWISGMSSYYMDGYEQSQIVQLGILQKLFEEGPKQTGKDGNIGVKLPHYLSELGVKNIECRVSDKVNFLNPNVNQKDKERLYNSLKEDGIGGEPANKESFIKGLINRGITLEEAQKQYESELLFSQIFNIDSSLVCAPSMKITFGEVKRY